MKNLFCDHSDLRNEADVEQNFARRFIEVLGYADKDIRPKAALEELTVGKLGETRLYRPDFAMKSGGHIRWVLEAKRPSEEPKKYFDQANGYCEAINNSYSSSKKPVEWFVLTNGIKTCVYSTGSAQPTLVMHFGEFADDNQNYQRELYRILPTGLIS